MCRHGLTSGDTVEICGTSYVAHVVSPTEFHAARLGSEGASAPPTGKKSKSGLADWDFGDVVRLVSRSGDDGGDPDPEHVS